MSDKAERAQDFEHRLAELERRMTAKAVGAPFPAPEQPVISRSDKTRRGAHAAVEEPETVKPGDYIQPASSLQPAESGSVMETPLVRHNRLGEAYTIKLVYPGFYLTLTPGSAFCVVGFPASKERLAKSVQPGHMFFVYVTSPERRVIGMAQAAGAAEFLPENDYKRPWSLDLAWVIGPRSPGVQFSDIGLQIKARVGDSTYSITDEVAAALIERLQDMDDLTGTELGRLKERYKMYG